jgi:hypothetical protein
MRRPGIKAVWVGRCYTISAHLNKFDAYIKDDKWDNFAKSEFLFFWVGELLFQNSSETGAAPTTEIL